MKPSQHNTSDLNLTTLQHVTGWFQQLKRLHQRIAPRFARAEPRQRALTFLQAILSPLERKTSWQIAEQAREATPYGMQRLLSRAVCDVDGLRDDLRTYALEHLGTHHLILALDETCFPKQGQHSAGVKSQWCGSSGQVENCQVGVFLSLCTSLGHTLIDRDLYLPAEWIADPARCQQAAIPDGQRFATKPELAAHLLSRFLQACPTLSVCWVVADSIYGGNPDFRAFLHQHQLSFVLAVSSQEPVILALPDGTCRRLETSAVLNLAGSDLCWQSLCVGDGSKGPRLSDWTRLPLLHQGRDDGQHWLLIRRSQDDPTLLWFFLAFAPLGTALADLALAWGARWHIEEDFEAAKDLGLDQYQVRSWTGWYRHITLVLLALAFLRALCVRATFASSSHTLSALTPHELRSILSRLLFPAPCQPAFVLSWSLWRRRHQGLARLCHTQRRARAG